MVEFINSSNQGVRGMEHTSDLTEHRGSGSLVRALLSISVLVSCGLGFYSSRFFPPDSHLTCWPTSSILATQQPQWKKKKQVFPEILARKDLGMTLIGLAQTPNYHSQQALQTGWVTFPVLLVEMVARVSIPPTPDAKGLWGEVAIT